MGRVISEDARYEALFRDVLGMEGGNADDPLDRGGPTRFGVSLRFLVIEGDVDLNHDGLADFDLDGDGDIDGADIRLLTVADARSLYRRCFWDRFKCGALPATLDGAMFDQAVNGGGKAAAKMLQRAVNRACKGRKGYPIKVDGDIGSVTLAGVRTARTIVPPAMLLSYYRQEACDRYRAICAAAPSQKKFLAGWLKRGLRLGSV